MKTLFFTPYFENEVIRKRPYVSKELVAYALENPIKVTTQPDGRLRHWSKISELGDRYLRVVTLADGVTVLNAFLDRNFNPTEAS